MTNRVSRRGFLRRSAGAAAAVAAAPLTGYVGMAETGAAAPALRASGAILISRELVDDARLDIAKLVQQLFDDAIAEERGRVIAMGMGCDD